MIPKKNYQEHFNNADFDFKMGEEFCLKVKLLFGSFLKDFQNVQYSYKMAEEILA